MHRLARVRMTLGIAILLGGCSDAEILGPGTSTPIETQTSVVPATTDRFGTLDIPGYLELLSAIRTAALDGNPPAIGVTWSEAATLDDVIARAELARASYAPPTEPWLLEGRIRGPSASNFDVEGGSVISVNGGPPSTRMVTYSAFSHCTGQCESASLEVGGEMRMVQVAQGGTKTLDTYNNFAALSPYAAGYYYTSVSGALQNASVSTQHYAELYWYYKVYHFSSASRSV